MELDQVYWTKRYEEGTTGWDTNGPTPPLTHYIDQIVDKELKILIPGAGNAYEAEYLFHHDFGNVDVIDFAKKPLDNLKNRVPEFPSGLLIQNDFFDHDDSYDLILEQTFFCAINPELRKSYVDKVHSLLKEGGKLVGVLWSVPMNEDHPPFGGSVEEYKDLFSDQFKIRTLAPCYNSIKPRQGTEVFINFEKK